AGQRLTHSPTVSREGDGSTEGNRNVLRVTPGLAGLVTQMCHSPAHLVGCEAGWRTQTNGVPAISPPGSTADCRRYGTTNPARWMGPAGWFRRKANDGKAYVLAVKTRLRGGPQGTKSPDILVAHCPTLAKCLQTEGYKFFLHPAHPHSQDDPATREGIERGDHFCRHQAIPVRQHHHPRPHFPPPRTPPP